MNISTLIRAEYLFLSNLFAGREPTRYYISGVRIEQLTAEGGCLLVATDGHRLSAMCEVLGRTTAPRTVLVPPILTQIWKQLTLPQRACSWFALFCADDLQTGQCEGRLFDALKLSSLDPAEVESRMRDITSPDILWAGGVELIDGKFPEWRRVVPPKITANATPVFLRRCDIRSFLRVAKVHGDGAIKIISNATDPAAPAFVDCGRRDFFGLIMPVKHMPDSIERIAGEYIAPHWLDLDSVSPIENPIATD